MFTDHSTTITALEGLLTSGVRQLTVDGVTTTYQSASDIRKEIQRLKAEDTANGYTKRPRVRSINLRGAF